MMQQFTINTPFFGQKSTSKSNQKTNKEVNIFSKSSPSKYRSAEIERERERENLLVPSSKFMRHTLRYERERERENLGILELLSQAEFMRHTLIATFSGNQCMTRKIKAIIFQS